MLEFMLGGLLVMFGLFLAAPFIIGFLFLLEIFADMLFDVKMYWESRKK
jgi:hypothetical protein